jgi:hypothetical protein
MGSTEIDLWFLLCANALTGQLITPLTEKADKAIEQLSPVSLSHCQESLQGLHNFILAVCQVLATASLLVLQMLPQTR